LLFFVGDFFFGGNFADAFPPMEPLGFLFGGDDFANSFPPLEAPIHTIPCYRGISVTAAPIREQISDDTLVFIESITLEGVKE
jgi:hypothetical protein